MEECLLISDENEIDIKSEKKKKKFILLMN